MSVGRSVRGSVLLSFLGLIGSTYGRVSGFVPNLLLFPSVISFPNRLALFLSPEYCFEARKGQYMFYATNGGVALIVLGLIHFLMCLSANYAHIKGTLNGERLELGSFNINQ